MKYIFYAFLTFYIFLGHAQTTSFNKYIIDQNKLYNLTIKNEHLVLEARELDKSYDMVTYRLVPAEGILNANQIIWDIQQGYIYVINIAILNNENMLSSLKKYKITELKTDLNFSYTASSFTAIKPIENRPFFELNEKSIQLDKYIIDLSVNEKINMIISTSTNAMLFSTSDGIYWEKTEFNSEYFNKYVAFKNEYFISDEIVYLNLNCEKCPQLKSLHDIKRYPNYIVNKDEKLLIEAPAQIAVPEFIDYSLKINIDKTCKALLFE